MPVVVDALGCITQALLASPQFSGLLGDMARAGLEPKTSEGALLLVAPDKHAAVRHALAGVKLRFYHVVIAEARAARTMHTACNCRAQSQGRVFALVATGHVS